MRLARTTQLLLVAAAFAAVAVFASQRSARSRQIARGRSGALQSVYRIIDGQRVHSRVALGAAAEFLPVVLVHGFGASSSYFVPTGERLAACFRVHAPDLPGHGKSDAPGRALDVSDLARALRGYMESMRVRRAAVVAHSMGCQVAVELAVRDPDLVDRLVLIGPAMDCASRSFGRALMRFLRSSAHERLSLNALLAIGYARMIGRLGGEFRAMRSDRIESKLRLLNVPILLVRGQQDVIAPQRWLDELARRSPHARTAVVRGWGHAVQYSAANGLTRIVVPFLKRAVTSSGTVRERR